MRSSESCFGNQTAGKVTENKNSQRQLTFLPQLPTPGSTQGDGGGGAERPEPLLSDHVH